MSQAPRSALKDSVRRASGLHIVSRNETAVSFVSKNVRTSAIRASSVIDAAAFASVDHEPFPEFPSATVGA